MSFQRRRFLQILSCAFGSSFILPQNELERRHRSPHNQRVLLRLPSQLLNRREEPKWKK